MMLDRRSLLASLAATPFAEQTPCRREQRLFADGFRRGLDQWVVEAEKSATVQATGGVLDIITPGGLTAWFKPELVGPVAITYQAQAVSSGGPYDRVSDLNAFWMAREIGGGSPWTIRAAAPSPITTRWKPTMWAKAATATRRRASAGMSDGPASGRCCRGTIAQRLKTC